MPETNKPAYKRRQDQFNGNNGHDSDDDQSRKKLKAHNSKYINKYGTSNFKNKEGFLGKAMPAYGKVVNFFYADSSTDIEVNNNNPSEESFIEEYSFKWLVESIKEKNLADLPPAIEDRFDSSIGNISTKELDEIREDLERKILERNEDRQKLGSKALPIAVLSANIIKNLADMIKNIIRAQTDDEEVIKIMNSVADFNNRGQELVLDLDIDPICEKEKIYIYNYIKNNIDEFDLNLVGPNVPETLMHIAVRLNELQFAKWLLENGARTDYAETVTSLVPINKALEAGNFDMAMLILEHDEKCNWEGRVEGRGEYYSRALSYVFENTTANLEELVLIIKKLYLLGGTLSYDLIDFTVIGGIREHFKANEILSLIKKVLISILSYKTSIPEGSLYKFNLNQSLGNVQRKLLTKTPEYMELVHKIIPDICGAFNEDEKNEFREALPELEPLFEEYESMNEARVALQ